MLFTVNREDNKIGNNWRNESDSDPWQHWKQLSIQQFLQFVNAQVLRFAVCILQICIIFAITVLIQFLLRNSCGKLKNRRKMQPPTMLPKLSDTTQTMWVI